MATQITIPDRKSTDYPIVLRHVFHAIFNPFEKTTLYMSKDMDKIRLYREFMDDCDCYMWCPIITVIQDISDEEYYHYLDTRYDNGMEYTVTVEDMSDPILQLYVKS